MCSLRLAADNYLECRSLLLLVESTRRASELSELQNNKKQDDNCRPAFSIGEILLLKQNQLSVKFDACIR